MEMITYREAMEKKKISITELARIIGMSKANLQQKIDYERSFKDHELMAFCEVCNCKPTDMRIKGYNY